MATTVLMEQGMQLSLVVQMERMEMEHSFSTLISVSNVHLENFATGRHPPSQGIVKKATIADSVPTLLLQPMASRVKNALLATIVREVQLLQRVVPRVHFPTH